MSSLEDAVNESVPGNDFVKPLMIAAGVLLLGHLFAGKKEEIPTDPSLPPAAGGGGLLGSLGGLFGGGAQQPGFPTGGAADPAGGASAPWPGPAAAPAGGPAAPAGGGFGGFLGGLANSQLGAALAGAVAGTAVSGGLDTLLNQFRGAGHAEAANSWVGPGENHPIAPDQVNAALGQDRIAEIAKAAGISPEQMSQLLAQSLPTLVDKLTPNGQVHQG
jgi:uncharacterized protein YidB (DUF937 family)